MPDGNHHDAFPAVTHHGPTHAGSAISPTPQLNVATRSSSTSYVSKNQPSGETRQQGNGHARLECIHACVRTRERESDECACMVQQSRLLLPCQIPRCGLMMYARMRLPCSALIWWCNVCSIGTPAPSALRPSSRLQFGAHPQQGPSVDMRSGFPTTDQFDVHNTSTSAAGKRDNKARVHFAPPALNLASKCMLHWTRLAPQHDVNNDNWFETYDKKSTTCNDNGNTNVCQPKLSTTKKHNNGHTMNEECTRLVGIETRIHSLANWPQLS